MSMLIKFWRYFLVFLSNEWMLTKTKIPNGGAIILARSTITSIYLFSIAIILFNMLDPDRGFDFSRTELQVQVVEHMEWYGVLFAAVYTALYARFSSQWSYLAGLYNNIKQTECNMHNVEVIAEWKSGFIEDSENLHLCCKSSFAPIIKVWAEDDLVKKKYLAHTPGGENRYAELMSQVDKSLKIISKKYDKKA